MKGLMKNRLIAFFLIWAVCMVFGADAVRADNLGVSDKKRVLYISSYSYAWETVPEQIDGI